MTNECAAPYMEFGIGGAVFFLLSVVLHVVMFYWARRRRRMEREGANEETRRLLGRHSIPRPLPREANMSLEASSECIDFSEEILNRSGFYHSIQLNLPSASPPGGTMEPPATRSRAPNLPVRRDGLPNPQTAQGVHGQMVKQREQKPQDRHCVHVNKKMARRPGVPKPPQTVPKRRPVCRDKTKHEIDAGYNIPDDPVLERTYEEPFANIMDKPIASITSENLAGFEMSYEIPAAACKGKTEMTQLPEKLDFNSETNPDFGLSYELPVVTIKHDINTRQSADKQERVGENTQKFDISYEGSDAATQCQTDVTVCDLELALNQPMEVYVPQSKLYATECIKIETPPKLPPRLHKPPTPGNEQYMDMQFSSSKLKQDEAAQSAEKALMDNTDTENGVAMGGTQMLEVSLGPPEAPAPPLPYVPRLPDRRPVKK